MPTRKPRHLSRDSKIIIVVVAALVALVIVALVGGFLNGAARKTNSTAQPTPSATQVALSTRAQVAADVRETTKNVKSYLATHPTASNDAIQNARVANTRPKTERINIAGNYKLWYVVGVDTRLDKNDNYTYQSLTNTYRWYNNKTGKSTEITVDAQPRNKGARN